MCSVIKTEAIAQWSAHCASDPVKASTLGLTPGQGRVTDLFFFFFFLFFQINICADLTITVACLTFNIYVHIVHLSLCKLTDIISAI